MKKTLKSCLKTIPTFWNGFRSVYQPFRIDPIQYKVMTDEEAAEFDAKSIRGDFEAVGNDIKRILRSLK